VNSTVADLKKARAEREELSKDLEVAQSDLKDCKQLIKNVDSLAEKVPSNTTLWGNFQKGPVTDSTQCNRHEVSRFLRVDLHFGGDGVHFCRFTGQIRDRDYRKRPLRQLSVPLLPNTQWAPSCATG